jgi:hypothetical protein
MTPEKALGRLINLREQLGEGIDSFCDERAVVCFGTKLYSAIIDDLDDIIRSIERHIKEGMPFDVDEFPEPEDDRDEDERR